MNYMMVYEKYHKVFLLVIGDHSRPVTVWGLKLDLGSLGKGRKEGDTCPEVNGLK
jgi:hypothetical protein